MGKKIKKNSQKSFNDYVREVNIMQSYILSETILKGIDISKVELIINDLKSRFDIDCKIGKVGGNIDYLTYCKIIDTVYDILFVVKLKDKSSFKRNFKILNSKLIKEFSDKKIGYELFIVINKISFLFDKRNLIENKYSQDIIENLTALILSNTLYVVSYLIKFENKCVRGIETNNLGQLVLKYNKVKLVEEELLIKLKRGIVNENCGEEYIEFTDKFMGEIHYSYSNYLDGNDNSNKEDNYYYLNNDYLENALYKNGKGIISIEELRKVPEERRYLYKAGVRFTFLKRSSLIKYVDIIEKENEFNFIVKIENRNNIKRCINRSNFNEKYNKSVTRKEFDEEDFETIKEKDILVEFNINKDSLNQDWNEKELLFLIMSSSRRAIMGESHVIIAVNYLLMSCLYMSLYNPFLFKKIINVSNIRKKGSEYIKEDSFRVAHIRKLSKGQLASNLAKKNAKLFGVTIPAGYTFVSAHYSKDDVEEAGSKKEIDINL